MKFIGFYNYTVILTYISLFSGVFGIGAAANGFEHEIAERITAAHMADSNWPNTTREAPMTRPSTTSINRPMEMWG